MKNIMALTLGLAIGVSTISMSSNAFAKSTMTGAEIKQSLIGNKFTTKGRRWAGFISFTATTFKGKNTRNGKVFNGNWWLKGDKYCFENNFGDKGCASIRKKKDGKFVLRGTTYTIK